MVESLRQIRSTGSAATPAMPYPGMTLWVFALRKHKKLNKKHRLNQLKQVFFAFVVAIQFWTIDVGRIARNKAEDAR